jgi:branched-chain amino acid aminotransferase
MALVPFDDRDGFVWWNGNLVPWRDAKLHVLSHGLHYASAVFEGERAYNGKVFKLREHSQRLLDSARILGFEIPYTVEEIDAATNAVVAANGQPDCYIRPIAWRGSEMMGVSAQQSKINVAIASWAWGSYFSDKEKGIRMCWAKWSRPAPNTAPTSSKAAGLYMICTMSKHEAEKNGYADALMLDWRGQIAEATGANIFLAIDGVLHTPKPDCFLDGITRRSVIAMAKARQIQIVERAIWPDELAQAQEAFLTGTAAEITPVGEIDKYRFTPGPITKALLEDFGRATRGEVDFPIS